ncbi:MAG: 2-C-methyl-D-erythritol 4-phosphate cytidylyltransferase [Kangiellaceae bacterium]|jgi:2-C-methyl-D-erythritol 4-phosphate cytidylyltransferase|nr:2-C-methyl-D-erythritol 4-phosphate cytidylyltransferase [Kangiellaceae bacterium]
MNKHSSALWVVIPAAGAGSRMQAERPKQYLTINQQPLILFAIKLFEQHPEVDGVVVVIDDSDPYWPEISQQCSDKVITASGGAERSDSVLKGLNLIRQKLSETELADAWVLVHDAARPCLTTKDVNQLLSVREKYPQGALLAAPVVDTLKRVNQSSIKTYDRREFVRAMTPQMAPLTALIDALNYCNKHDIAITDEAQALEEFGHQVGIVIGSSHNIKVTYPDDLVLADLYLTQFFDDVEN